MYDQRTCKLSEIKAGDTLICNEWADCFEEGERVVVFDVNGRLAVKCAYTDKHFLDGHEDDDDPDKLIGFERAP